MADGAGGVVLLAELLLAAAALAVLAATAAGWRRGTGSDASRTARGHQGVHRRESAAAGGSGWGCTVAAGPADRGAAAPP